MIQPPKYPKNTVDVTGIEYDIESLSVERKAELFDALMSQERIRVVGHAQLGNPNYQHIGVEMWSHHLGGVDDSESRAVLLKYLSTIADRDK